MTADAADLFPSLFDRAVASFGSLVRGVPDDQWAAPTPCTDWDVRTLVNHLVYEMVWAPPLFAGATIAEVGDRFEGDLLGDDPRGAWDPAGAGAAAAVNEPGAMRRTVHLSFGDVPGEEYARQLHADLLVHGWDLARATAQTDVMDPEAVAACAAWFADRAELYRGSGATGPRPDVPADASPQTRLLAEFGRRG